MEILGGVRPCMIHTKYLVVQAVHWIDTWNQLVIYNPLTHPSNPPVHEYQAYLISNPSRLSTVSTFSFEIIKFPAAPVEAFGNTSLQPWFWFQTLHQWNPGIRDLIISAATASSDIGLIGRGTLEEISTGWRIWSIEDENRRAAVPYDMEKGEETIVAGMQLDFTATKNLEKPLYPDEQLSECGPLMNGPHLRYLQEISNLDYCLCYRLEFMIRSLLIHRI